MKLGREWKRGSVWKLLKSKGPAVTLLLGLARTVAFFSSLLFSLSDMDTGLCGFDFGFGFCSRSSVHWVGFGTRDISNTFHCVNDHKEAHYTCV